MWASGRPRLLGRLADAISERHQARVLDAPGTKKRKSALHGLLERGQAGADDAGTDEYVELVNEASGLRVSEMTTFVSVLYSREIWRSTSGAAGSLAGCGQ